LHLVFAVVAAQLPSRPPEGFGGAHAERGRHFFEFAFDLFLEVGEGQLARRVHLNKLTT
jgi:hypothetical protein